MRAKPSVPSPALETIPGKRMMLMGKPASRQSRPIRSGSLKPGAKDEPVPTSDTPSRAQSQPPPNLRDWSLRPAPKGQETDRCARSQRALTGLQSQCVASAHPPLTNAQRRTTGPPVCKRPSRCRGEHARWLQVQPDPRQSRSQNQR